jgi:hypothetical protein
MLKLSALGSSGLKLKMSTLGSSGANPTIVSFNAGAVKAYNATSSLVRFENKNSFLCLEKHSDLLQRRRCSRLERFYIKAK